MLNLIVETSFAIQWSMNIYLVEKHFKLNCENSIFLPAFTYTVFFFSNNLKTRFVTPFLRQAFK